MLSLGFIGLFTVAVMGQGVILEIYPLDLSQRVNLDQMLGLGIIS